MSTRRELLTGGACLVTSAVAIGLQPRRRRSLLGRQSLAAVVPMAFGAWQGRDVGDLVAPKIEGSLASRLYNQTVERIYVHATTGAEVMMLIAYGDTQSNELQLHRPESCYPAFGFQISNDRTTSLALDRAVALPVRRLVANAPGRLEQIVYWSRLGEYLPADAKQQDLARIKTALAGEIADGLLARFSSAIEDSATAFGVLDEFIVSLIRGVAPASRSALVGSRIAAAMGSSSGG